MKLHYNESCRSSGVSISVFFFLNVKDSFQLNLSLDLGKEVCISLYSDLQPQIEMSAVCEYQYTAIEHGACTVYKHYHENFKKILLLDS